MPRVSVPDNADDLRETLLSRAKMDELLQDPEAFADFVEGSVNARLKRDPDVKDQVNEQTEAFMINWLKENQLSDATAKRLNLDQPNALRRPRPTAIYNKAAAGAEYDSYFKDTANFLYSISSRSHKDSALSNKLGTLKNALGSIKPSDGGFLIPEILRAELLRVALETAIVRPRARVIPMDSLTVPFPTIDSTSNVSSIYGGITGYWTEEGATLAASQPRFGRIELRAQKLTLYTEVPNELAYDALPAFSMFMNEMFPEALAWFEDVGFFVGTGVGEPMGFLNAQCRVEVTRAHTGSHVEWPDIVGMYSRMLPQSLMRAVWLASPDVLPQLYSMTFPTVSGTAAAIMGGGLNVTGTDNPPLSLLGRPVIVSEKARALGTAGDLNFVDFGYYLLGDRQALSARQSEDFRFQNDLAAFRVIERVDGRPWLSSPITPQNNSSNTLSPIIKLVG